MSSLTAEGSVNKGMADGKVHLSEEAVKALSLRLANEPLTLPRSAGEEPDAPQRTEYLDQLLRRDPGKL